MDGSSFLITGANGQLGLALQVQYPKARKSNSNELNISHRESVRNYNWEGITHILNAAAYTNVDGAETPEGRVAAWEVNAVAVGYLAEIAREKNITLVHLSTDYVFDGSKNSYSENEPLCPLSSYASSKAAGDLLTATVNSHYLLRTSWVIGEGKNFVRTMLGLGRRGVSPAVVADQVGRLTFTSELARAIDHLLTTKASYGTYNVTNEGESVSWAEITREIFKLAGYNLQVTDTTTADYFAGKTGIAPRPLNSTLSLDKLHSAGFESRDWGEDLEKYVKGALQV